MGIYVFRPVGLVEKSLSVDNVFASTALDVIEISPAGLGMHFPKLDAELYLPAAVVAPRR